MTIRLTLSTVRRADICRRAAQHAGVRPWAVTDRSRTPAQPQRALIPAILIFVEGPPGGGSQRQGPGPVERPGPPDDKMRASVMWSEYPAEISVDVPCVACGHTVPDNDPRLRLRVRHDQRLRLGTGGLGGLAGADIHVAADGRLPGNGRAREQVRAVRHGAAVSAVSIPRPNVHHVARRDKQHRRQEYHACHTTSEPCMRGAGRVTAAVTHGRPCPVRRSMQHLASCHCRQVYYTTQPAWPAAHFRSNRAACAVARHGHLARAVSDVVVRA